MEVVFDDGAKHSISLAKHLDATLGAGSVACVGFALDIGEIACEIDSPQRRAVFDRLWGRFAFREKERHSFFLSQRQDLATLQSAVSSGMPIRIWSSNAAHCLCGLHFLCETLGDADCQISVVSLPACHQTSAQNVHTLCSWGMVRPDFVPQFLPLERPLLPLERQLYGWKWRDLATENAPLRAAVSGTLLSVPEDFYDFLLYAEMPKGDFLMARLIGTVMGKHAIDVSDAWYALRIEQMIAQNKLLVVGERSTSSPYNKILRLA